MGKNKNSSKSVSIEQAVKWVDEHSQELQAAIDKTIAAYIQETSNTLLSSLATKMTVSPAKAAVLQDQSRGVVVEISYGNFSHIMETRIRRVHVNNGHNQSIIDSVAGKLPKNIKILLDKITGQNKAAAREVKNKATALGRECFNRKVMGKWAATKLPNEYTIANSTDGHITLYRFGVKTRSIRAITKEQLGNVALAMSDGTLVENQEVVQRNMDIDDILASTVKTKADTGDAILTSKSIQKLEALADEAISAIKEEISSMNSIVSYGGRAGWYGQRVPHYSTDNKDLAAVFAKAEQEIRDIADRPVGTFSYNDTIQRQAKTEPEQINATLYFAGDVIVKYVSKSGEIIVKVDKEDKAEGKQAASGMKDNKAQSPENPYTFSVEIARNDKSAKKPPKEIAKAVKVSEKVLKELGKEGFSLVRNTGAGLISGKGDYTLINKKTGKELRSTLKTKNPERDIEAWENGVRDFVKKTMASFDAETSKADYAATVEALEYIHNFVERDIASILSNIEYMAVESLAPYLAGEDYFSSYPPYRPDLYDAKYKGFYTRKEIEQIISEMDKRNVIRTRRVDYRNHNYTRVNSLKASRKAEILDEKRYKFPLDELLEKCKDKNSVLDDFECEYLFWDIERKAKGDKKNDESCEKSGNGNGDENGEAKEREENALEIADYLMLMKMLNNPSFLAEYKKRYIPLMSSAPEMFATLLEVEKKKQSKGGMTKLIDDILAKMAKKSA